MSSFGTAPRRVNGIWRTRTGRRLTAEGSAYWEHLYTQKRTDGRGHMTAGANTAKVTQASPKAQKPLPPNWLTGSQTPKQKRQQAIYKKSQRATADQKAAIQQQTDINLFGSALPAVHKSAQATRLNPIAEAVFKGVSPGTAVLDAADALKHAEIAKAALSTAAIMPFGRGFKLARGVEKGIQAERAVGEASQAEKDVLGAMGAARRGHAEQAKLATVERGKRAAKLEPAFEEAGGGRGGFHAGLHELKGELPKVPFDRLIHLDGGQMDQLLTTVQQHADLLPYEKISLQAALVRAHEGLVPRPYEVKLVEKAFGPARAAEFGKRSLAQNAMHAVAEVANLPRSILASFDVSAPFRQALMAGAHNPRLFFKNFKPMFQALVSEKKYGAIMDEIAQRPSYQTMLDANLKLTDLGDLSVREEQFMSNLAEKVTGGKRGFVRASSRAYTGFLNRMRADMFDNLVNEVGLAGNETAAERRQIARFVNWATGRGELGPLEPAAVPLNTVLFSPRLFASRIQAINPQFYYSLSPFARKKALMSVMKLAIAGNTALGLAVLGGAKVVADPRNSDFGKIKVGNTRFDIWGGHQQIMRLMSQIASGKIVSSTTGKTLVLKGGYETSKQDIVKRFLEGKLAPTPSLINDWFRGTDFADKPFSWKRAVVARSYPLLIQDALDIYHGTDSPWKAIGGYGIGAFGVGVQTYGPRQPSHHGSSKGDPFGRFGKTNYSTPVSGSDPFSRFKKS